ncbi:efflux RND transporter periplasmic adaptor subunit [Microbulbifer bruguierae]|uniref:Efflux RND transporter periplasmic adaptor subunit n=1 Tax=Microbulbifer bruguierae TaxID=3029061 RepID=A0ABY8NBF2_9GAMM|nr:efflux RND transporter periplasmic adaptor subunit [Microbulbifer bruguierae]WGL16238.1 efflux RND transporter periplasmic adaptor subunit [Microbulbifer bruguierae]
MYRFPPPHIAHPKRFLRLAGLIAALVLSACTPPDTSAIKPPRPAIVVHPVVAGEQLAVYPGEVRARHEPTLAFRVGGAVTRRLVEAGDRVKRGQSLAELDSEDLLLQRDAAHAQLQAAETEKRNAANELTRYRELLARKLIGESQFDVVHTRHETSIAQLERARAQWKVASNQADYTVLKAPRDGVIARRMIDAGQVVSAGQAAFVLAADGEREVRIDIPEQQVDQFAVGQPVNIELWSNPGTPFAGQVREISPAAEAGLRTFEARVAFDNNAANAQPGQSARVFARTGFAEKSAAGHPSIQLPMAAITADENQAHVWKLDPEKFTLHKASVRVIRFGEDTAEVIADLTPQDWIVAAGTQLVSEGQQVRPVDRRNRPIELENSVAKSF